MLITQLVIFISKIFVLNNALIEVDVIVLVVLIVRYTIL